MSHAITSEDVAFPTEASAAEAHLDPERKRSLFCPTYNGCLHVAAVRGWRDWSCRACPRRDASRADLQAFAHDRRREH